MLRIIEVEAGSSEIGEAAQWPDQVRYVGTLKRSADFDCAPVMPLGRGQVAFCGLEVTEVGKDQREDIEVHVGRATNSLKGVFVQRVGLKVSALPRNTVGDVVECKRNLR